MISEFHFHDVPPQNPLPKFNHGKTSDKHQVRDSLLTTWPVLPKTVKGMNDKERPNTLQVKAD